MSNIAIAIEGLSKTFGKGNKAVEAVIDLNLEVQAGQVFGFLGPNGAGKTTTIRLLMDLIRPSSGEAFLFGKPTGSLESRKRVGALVEGADFYPFMSAWDNLVVLDRTAGAYQPERISELIESVGLSERAKQPVGGFSTGMKQRLGLAAALLNDPELLILDEPTNGLDPGGIQEMRGFIRQQAHTHGKTVFLSSHMLNEVEQVCDRVAIINEGVLLREGPVETLLEGEVGQMRLQVQPIEKAYQVINARWSDALGPIEGYDGDWITLSLNPDQAPVVVAELVQADVQVFQVIHKRQSLEEFFITVTNNAREGADVYLYRAEWRKVFANFKLTSFLVWIFPIGVLAFHTVMILLSLISETMTAGVEYFGSGLWTADSLNAWNMMITFPANLFGRMLPLAFMAVVFAGEYQWRTWKNIAPRTQRWKLILAKMAALISLVLISLALTALVSALGPSIGHLIHNLPYGPDLNPQILGSFLFDTVKTTFIVLLSLAVLAGYAAIAAITTRSILGGLMVSFGFSVLDAVSLGMLSLLGAIFNRPSLINLYKFTPSYNLSNAHSWLLRGEAEFAITDGISPLSTAPGFWVSLLVLAVWICGLIGLSLAIFQRQELTE